MVGVTNNNAAPARQETTPQAVVQARRTLSIIWLVPIAALGIAGWLVYKAIAEKGPVATIMFKSAEGLEAGQTKVKYKDVEVGSVDGIRFGPNLSNVLVTVKLDREMRPYLTDDARFWVVRARINLSQVSGLGTLLSGSYIAMEPGSPGAEKSSFEGLETPPAVTMDTPGTQYVLRADGLGSLEIGSPVYFRQVRVGEVTGYRLEPGSDDVSIEVFISAPHDQRVRTNSRFWNAGGIDVALDAGGFRLHTESVVTLLVGGIAFDNPVGLESAVAATTGTEFRLYPNREAVSRPVYTRKTHYLAYFDGSARGLAVGGPVELRGIHAGTVVDIKPRLDLRQNSFQIPVLLELQMDRFELVGLDQPSTDLSSLAEELIRRGLRAQLTVGNILTGQLAVSLDIYPDTPAVDVSYENEYPIIPTIPTDVEEIKAGVLDLVESIQRLPIQQIGDNLNETLAGLNEIVHSSDVRDSLANVNHATEQLKQTLERAEKSVAALGQDSPVYGELMRTLQELSAAARALRSMTEYLERRPEALLKGKAR